MCNCIQELQKKVIGTDWKGKKIVSAKFLSMAFMGPTFSSKSTSELEATVDGMKKPQIIPIVHSFCPFCGKEYVDKKEDKMKSIPIPVKKSPKQ